MTRFFLCLISILALSTSILAQTAAIDPAILAKANAGDASAQVAAGDRCAAGNGPERTNRQIVADYKLAAEWYRKAAAQGNIAGEMHLAALLRDGKGVERDMPQAVALYRKAAEQGDVTAQGTLGVLYSFGLGVTQDYIEAYFWLDIAASSDGPEKEHYAANRQMVGTHITAQELEAVQDRVDAWKASHSRTKSSQ